jgi:trimeric autotransporter adhesin
MHARRLFLPTAVIAAVLTGFVGAGPALASGGSGGGGGGGGFVAPPVPAIQLAPNGSTVAAGASDSAQIVLNPAAPAGGETLTITSSSPALSVPASLFVASGFNAQFAYTGNSVTAPTTATVTVRNIIGSASFPITVTPAVAPTLSAVSMFPQVVAGGDTVSIQPQLTASAPPGGVTVGLHSDSTLLAVPPTYFFPAGFSQSPLTAVVGHVTAPTIVHVTETLGTQSATGQIEIDPDRVLTGIAVNPTTADASQSVSGGVSISVPSQSGNDVVSLHSSDPAVASVPAVASFGSGNATANFPITLTPVTTPTTVTISATGGGVTMSATLTVVPTPPPPFEVNLVTVAPTVVAGTGTSTGTVTATTAAPAGGATIHLSSSDTKLATVPATVVIPAGATSATFPIKVTGSGATDISIGATFNNTGHAAPLGVTGAKGGSLIRATTTNQALESRPVNDIHLDTLGFYAGGVASVESGALPPGVALISNLRPGEFVFHGSPGRAGTYTFVLKFDGQGTALPYAIAYVWVITPA